MKTSLFLSAIVMVAVVSFTFGMTVFSPTAVTTISSEDQGATITYHAVVCKKVTRADGTIDNLGCSKNLFTHVGMNFTSWQLSGTIVGAANRSLANTSVDVIAIGVKSAVDPPCGTSAINASERYMCGEFNTTCGMQRARADAVRINDTDAPSAGNWTITKEFTHTCTQSIDVNVTGLFNTTTANQTGQDVFFAQNTFTTATLQTNDKINVTWFIWVT